MKKYRHLFIFNNDLGFTLTETLMGAAISMVLMVGLSSVITTALKAQKGANIRLESVVAQNEIARLVNDGYALGAGLSSAAALTMANVFDPDSVAAQPIKLLNSANGVAVAYDAYVGPIATTPAVAKIGDYLVIRKITLTKKREVGDVNLFRYSGTAIDLDRRFIDAVIDIELENTAVASQLVTGVLPTITKSIPVALVVERIHGSAGSWKIAKTGAPGGSSFNIGWRDPALDCLPQIEGGINSLVTCPPGYFISAQITKYQANWGTFACAPCGKSGCATCSFDNSTANATITCCKVNK